VIGVGNADRGDDAAGLAVARRLSGLQGAEVIARRGEMTELIEALSGNEWVALVDAAAGLVPGEVRRLDASAKALPVDTRSSSTHGMGAAQAIELARALGQLPPRCIVYAIGGKSFAAGAALSPSVETAVSHVVGAIMFELEQLRSEGADA
jgi:hydrogenase maturation protease